MSVDQARHQAQVQHLRRQRLHHAAVQAQAQAQADRREAAQRAPVNGQFGAYGFRTLPQPTATQAKPTRLPLREDPGPATCRVPDKETAEGLEGLMSLLAQLGDDGRVDPDGESRGGQGGHGGHGGDSGGGSGSGGGASQEGGHDAEGQRQGDQSPTGDQPGRDAGGSGGGQSGSGQGGTGQGSTGQGGSGHGDGRQGGGGRDGGRSSDRGPSTAGLSRRIAGADRRRDWSPPPQAGLRDLAPLLARFHPLQRSVPEADEGAHALASALIAFGGATAPPGRPGVGVLRLAAMAAYIDAQAAPGALATLAGVKDVLMTHVVTSRAAAASPAGSRAPNQWALLPLELLVCDKPRTGSQRRLAVERLQAAHGFLGRFKTATKGRP